MGVRILEGDGACLYCSTSMWAFGPVFEDRDQAQAFLEFLGAVDARTLGDHELELKYGEFLATLEAGSDDT